MEATERAARAEAIWRRLAEMTARGVREDEDLEDRLAEIRRAGD